MPIYEYICHECEKTFEQIRRFSDPPLEACVLCGAHGPEKLVSASAFHLKGSGWYATDYGTSASTPPEKDTAVANTDSEAPSTSSDTTTSKEPDTKTDTAS